MSDRPSGPRRITPVPGLLDIDAIEDANLAEAFGEDAPDRNETPRDDDALADALGLEDDFDVAATSARATVGIGPAGEPVSDLEGEPVPDLEVAPEPESSGTPGDPAALLPPADLDAETLEAPPLETPVLEDAAVETEPVAEADLEVDPPAPTDLESRQAGAANTGLVPPAEVMETAKAATKDRGRELVQLVVKYGKEHVPETPPKPAMPDTGPPRMVGRVGQLIPFLRVIPWLLAALFALSFWWDFTGLEVALFGQSFPIEGLLKVLTVSGLIGFGTNWLAITMLFQPREKRAIIPQGLIPAQRERVIYRLSEAISRELINADIIKQRIQESGVIGRYRDLALDVVRGVVEDPGFRTDLKTIAQGYAQEVLGSESVRREVARLAVSKVEEQAGGGLGGVALRLYRTFAEDDFQRRVDRALDELPDAVVPLLDRIDSALDAVPAKVEDRADEIEEAATNAVLSFVEGFDVRTMISERARQFDEGQLEGLLKSTSNEQLNYIKYLGAILGVFGGFVIWAPLASLAVFLTIGLALWGIDEALVRARR
ncbi:DUF445 family protein [Rubrivirga sp.]|uniref:DUF445 family protein n=1 Tax=Rubrivirga sp. TaxID=1885344 RepID=UPI003C76A91E